MRNAADAVNAQYTALNSDYDTLQRDLDAAMQVAEAVPDIEESAALRRRVQRLRRELNQAERPLEPRRPEVSATDLRKAEDERDHAERMLLAAPEAELQAKADLRTAQAALAAAQVRHETATEALHRAEETFIAGIDISGPDAQGFIEARAIFNQPLPAAYEVRWIVDAGTYLDSVGTEFRIDTHAIPPGTWVVEAHVERTGGSGSLRSAMQGADLVH